MSQAMTDTKEMTEHEAIINLLRVTKVRVSEYLSSNRSADELKEIVRASKGIMAQVQVKL